MLMVDVAQLSENQDLNVSVLGMVLLHYNRLTIIQVHHLEVDNVAFGETVKGHHSTADPSSIIKAIQQSTENGAFEIFALNFFELLKLRVWDDELVVGLVG